MSPALLGLSEAGQLPAKAFQILSSGDAVLAAGLKTVQSSRPSVVIRGSNTENLWSQIRWEGVRDIYVCVWDGG